MTDHTPKPADAIAARANQLLARTINIGLNLGSPAEASWTVPVDQAELHRCADAGFTAVRLVASLALHRNATDALRLDPAALDQIDTVIASATERGLAVVLAKMTDQLLGCTDQLADRLERPDCDSGTVRRTPRCPR